MTSLTVALATGDEYDTYGGRKRRNGQLCDLNNTNPPAPGWLGNPHKMDDDTAAERRRVIAAYLRDFLDRVEESAQFRDAVDHVRDHTVACWCRGVSHERHEDNFCHLDVVAAYQAGDLTPVFESLRDVDVDPDPFDVAEGTDDGFRCPVCGGRKVAQRGDGKRWCTECPFERRPSTADTTDQTGLSNY